MVLAQSLKPKLLQCMRIRCRAGKMMAKRILGCEPPGSGLFQPFKLTNLNMPHLAFNMQAVWLPPLTHYRGNVVRLTQPQQAPLPRYNPNTILPTKRTTPPPTMALRRAPGCSIPFAPRFVIYLATYLLKLNYTRYAAIGQSLVRV